MKAPDTPAPGITALDGPARAPSAPNLDGAPAPPPEISLPDGAPREPSPFGKDRDSHGAADAAARLLAPVRRLGELSARTVLDGYRNALARLEVAAGPAGAEARMMLSLFDEEGAALKVFVVPLLWVGDAEGSESLADTIALSLRLEPAATRRAVALVQAGAAGPFSLEAGKLPLIG